MTVLAKKPAKVEPLDALQISTQALIDATDKHGSTWVSTALLNIDYTYQRGEKWVWKRIVKQWNVKACDPLVVARRLDDYSLWIMDGGQRFRAIKALGFPTALARVMDMNGAEEEAELYALLNGLKARNTAREMFKSWLRSRNTVAVGTLRAVESSGFEIGMTHSSGTWPKLNCVKCLIKAYVSYGEDTLSRGLSALFQAYPRQKDIMNGAFIEAIAKVFHRHGNTWSKQSAFDDMTKRMAKIPINELEGSMASRGGSSRFMRPYNRFLAAWNKGRRRENHLPELTLSECMARREKAIIKIHDALDTDMVDDHE